MKRPLLFLLLLLVLPAIGSETPGLLRPLPFDHARHAGAFEKGGLVCQDCHPVGLYVPTEAGPRAPDSALPPPLGTCHGCHLEKYEGAVRKAPSECMTCHADRRELLPADHDLAWIPAHGLASRTRGNTCSDCHEKTACVDCHDERSAGSRNPHPAAFRTTHGIEAKVDSYSCGSCHVQNDCTTCHETGVYPW